MIDNHDGPLVIDDANHLWDLGLEQAEEGDIGGALVSLKKAHLIEPDNPFILNSLAHTESENGNPEEAEILYTKSKELRPDDFIISSNRGRNRLSLGNFHGAIEDFGDAIKIRPEEAIVHYLKGMAHSRVCQREDALEEYSKVIEIDDEFAEAYFVRGVLHEQKANHELAIQDFMTLLEIEPENSDAAFRVANNAMQLGSQQIAKAYLKKAFDLVKVDAMKYIELNPEEARGFKLLGDICYSMEEYENAVTAFSGALKLGDRQLKTYRWRAYALQSLGRHQEAIKDFDQILKIAPDEAEYLDDRARSKMAISDLIDKCSEYQDQLDVLIDEELEKRKGI